MSDKLLNAQDYHLINQLHLKAKRKVTGLLIGEQRSPVQSGGIEFADYRDYQPGDDIRRIDWAVFLRLRRLLIKLCAEEKELTLIIILDNSHSMRFGDHDKLVMAERLAVILAGIALKDGNRAGVFTLGSSLRELYAPARGKASLAAIVKAVSKIDPMKKVDIDLCIRQFVYRYRNKCLFVFISDLLYPEWSSVLGGLAAASCEGYVIQVLSREEIDPPYLGEVTLVDTEGWGDVELHVGEDITRRYLNELNNFLRDVRRTCHRNGLGYAMVASDSLLTKTFHIYLRQEGLVC